jgi:hypothetical protein
MCDEWEGWCEIAGVIERSGGGAPGVMLRAGGATDAER